jgi:hypothetical protein
MQDLRKLEEELRRSGKLDALRALAASGEGKSLGGQLDGAAAEQALRSGDTAALQAFLRGVLQSGEGRRLAEQIRSVMEGK